MFTAIRDGNGLNDGVVSRLLRRSCSGLSVLTLRLEIEDGAASVNGKEAGAVMSVYVKLGDALREQKLMLAAAESCTGGLFASNLTRIPGSSEWFYGAFVTYTLAAKMRWLGVDAQLLDRFGAVSEPCARAMASGGLASSGADLCVAITGLAGPGGGDPLTPLGTVYFGWARRGDSLVTTGRYQFSGSRDDIRDAAAWQAATGLLELLS